MISIDFETYSEAGFTWSDEHNKWIADNPKYPGLLSCGVRVYAEHPSAEVLCLAYKLTTGPVRLWTPKMPAPLELFDAISHGTQVSAWNSMFEFEMWNRCFAVKHHPTAPKLQWDQMVDPKAAAALYGIPTSLEKAGQVMGIKDKKLDMGKDLIKLFSIPRNPTKSDPRRRVLPSEEPEKAVQFYEYCIQDVKAETELRKLIPPLSEFERMVWLCNQRINHRGISVDVESVKALARVVTESSSTLETEIQDITDGFVETPNQRDRIIKMLRVYGLKTKTLDKVAVEELLALPDIRPTARKILQIRQEAGSGSVKKVFNILHRLSKDNCVHDLFEYAGADRTGRWAGRGPQPHNFPNFGGDMEACEDTLARARAGWNPPFHEMAGTLRALMCVSDDHICSDYSSIEARVLAMLAGERWQIEVFKSHGMIYEMTAAKIFNIPLTDFIEYKKTNGKHHPYRKHGKIASLASGYQGSVGAWKQFGAGEIFKTDAEIKDAVLKWRAANPNIVNYWDRTQSEVVDTIQHKIPFDPYRKSYMQDNVLHIRLVSGRTLKYHAPWIAWEPSPWIAGARVPKIKFIGIQKPSRKWGELDTYGGRLVENIVQATARDILAYAMVGLEKAGYEIVMHVHDEIVAKMPEHGSIKEFETIMTTMPEWAESWPIEVGGTWVGRRYRK